MAETVLAKLAVEISANTAQFGKALNQASGSFDAFSKTLSGANKLLAGFGIGFGINQVAGAISSVVGTLAGFEQQMATVKAITGATDAQFELLTESALKLGQTSQFTAQQVAELQTEFGRLGFSATEILAATKATVALATATGENLAKSADVAGSTLRAFGLEASDTGKVVDIMAAGFNRSALGLDNFAEAMKYVAPVARAAGITLEETTALLGVLADNGIRGSTAGTSLRKIITDLANSGKPLNDRLADLAKTGLTFSGAFDEVGRTAQSSLLVLTNNKARVDDFAKSLINVTGEAQRTADIVGDTLAGDVKRLGGAWDSFIIGVSNGTGIIRGTVKALTDLVGVISVLTGGVKEADLSFVKAIKPEDVNETLENLNKIREAAKLEGDRQTEIEAIRVIAALTGQFKLLKDQSTDTGTEIKKVDEELKVQLSVIAALEEKLAKYKEEKENAFSPEAIAIANDKIKDVKDQIDLLNASTAKTTQTFKDLAAGAQISIPSTSVAAPTSLPITVPQVDGLKTVTEDLEKVNKALAKNKEEWDSWGQGVVNQNELARMAYIDMSSVAQSGFTAIGQVIGQALSGTQNFGTGIIKALSSFAKQFGEILIASGVAGLALKTLSTNPAAAIAAGVALVAIGEAASAAAKEAQSKTIGGGSSSGSSRATAATAFTSSSKPIDVVVTGRIVSSGREMAVVLDNYNNKTGRTG